MTACRIFSASAGAAIAAVEAACMMLLSNAFLNSFIEPVESAAGKVIPVPGAAPLAAPRLW